MCLLVVGVLGLVCLAATMLPRAPVSGVDQDDRVILILVFGGVALATAALSLLVPRLLARARLSASSGAAAGSVALRVAAESADPHENQLATLYMQFTIAVALACCPLLLGFVLSVVGLGLTAFFFGSALTFVLLLLTFPTGRRWQKRRGGLSEAAP